MSTMNRYFITGMHLKNHNLFKHLYVVLRTKHEEGHMVSKIKDHKKIEHIQNMKTVDVVGESR